MTFISYFIHPTALRTAKVIFLYTLTQCQIKFKFWTTAYIDLMVDYHFYAHTVLSILIIQQFCGQF